MLDYLAKTRSRGEIATGLLFLEESGADMHGFEGTVDQPFVDVPYETLSPGSAALEQLQTEWR